MQLVVDFMVVDYVLLFATVTRSGDDSSFDRKWYALVTLSTGLFFENAKHTSS